MHFKDIRFRLPKRILTGLIVGGFLAEVALIYAFYTVQTGWVRDEVGRQLKVIVDVQTDVIAGWRHERISDGEAISANSIFGAYMREALRTSGEAITDTRITSWFEQVIRNYDYRGIQLFDELGKLRLSLTLRPEPVDTNASSHARDLIEQKRVSFLDFHTHDEGKSIHVAVMAPLKDERGDVVAAVILWIDADDFLFPHLKLWPAPTRTGETLLVRREPDHVTYLNELRHRKNTALKLSVPLTRTDVPAIQVASGHEGLVDGKDYRGIAVVGAMRHVPDSPWALMAKIDEEEAFSPLRMRTYYFAALISVCLILCVCAVALMWSRREAQHYRKAYKAELERLSLATRYETLHRYANDVILLLDEHARIIEVNERAVETYGYSREKLLTMSARDLRPSSNTSPFEENWATAQSFNGKVFEILHSRADGSILPVEVSIRAFRISGRAYWLAILRDITERKNAEALRDSQADLNRAQAVAHVGSWRLNPRTNELKWSEASCERSLDAVEQPPVGAVRVLVGLGGLRRAAGSARGRARPSGRPPRPGRRRSRRRRPPASRRRRRSRTPTAPAAPGGPSRRP